MIKQIFTKQGSYYKHKESMVQWIFIALDLGYILIGMFDGVIELHVNTLALYVYMLGRTIQWQGILHCK